VPRGQSDGSLQPYFRISRLELLLFLPSSSSIVLTRLSGPHLRPTTSERNVVVPEIKPRPLNLQPGTLANQYCLVSELKLCILKYLRHGARL
jgi:hypothetical protein